MLKKANLKPATVPEDYDRCLGMLALLGANSTFGQMHLTGAVSVLHGALKSESFRIYLGSTDRPSAAVIWAFLSDAVAEEYLKTGFLPNLAAWNSGDQLWFLHVIAEGGKVRDIITDAQNDEIFKHVDTAYMLRTSPTGQRRVVGISRRGIKLVRNLPSAAQT